MSSIEQHSRSGRLQWRTLLLACALVCAQTLALEHVHVEDAPGEACVICVHGDAPAALENTAQLAAAPAGAYHFLNSYGIGKGITSPLGYLTRAPPQA